MTLPSRPRIRNSSTGGLRPSTLPLGHRGSPQYSMPERGRARDLQLSKQAAYTTAPEPRIEWDVASVSGLFYSHAIGLLIHTTQTGSPHALLSALPPPPLGCPPCVLCDDTPDVRGARGPPSRSKSVYVCMQKPSSPGKSRNNPTETHTVWPSIPTGVLTSSKNAYLYMIYSTRDVNSTPRRMRIACAIIILRGVKMRCTCIRMCQPTEAAVLVNSGDDVSLWWKVVASQPT